MNDARNDPSTPVRPNGGEPEHAAGAAILDAVRALDRVETAALDFVTASLSRPIAASQDLAVGQIAVLAAIGAAALEAVEKIGCKASASASGVAELVITSSGGLVRRLIATFGETTRSGLSQIAETSRQLLDDGRDTFERNFDSARRIGEASVQFAEGVAVRSLDAGAALHGALRGALRLDGRAQDVDRPSTAGASKSARAAS